MKTRPIQTQRDPLPSEILLGAPWKIAAVAPVKPSDRPAYETAYARALFRRQVQGFREFMGFRPGFAAMRKLYQRSARTAHAAVENAGRV